MQFSHPETIEPTEVFASLARLVRHYGDVHTGGVIERDRPSDFSTAPATDGEVDTIVDTDTEVEIPTSEQRYPVRPQIVQGSGHTAEGSASEETTTDEEIEETTVVEYSDAAGEPHKMNEPSNPEDEEVEEVEEVEDTTVGEYSDAAGETHEGDEPSDSEDDDLDELNIDVSAYLPGGSTPSDSPDISPTPTNDDEASQEEAPVASEQPTPLEASVEQGDDEEDDFDLGDFDPQKYLSTASSGSASASSESAEEGAADTQMPVAPVNISSAKRDPVSLLRELSSLSK